MKQLLHYPIAFYIVAGLACLCIMVVIDYLLGAEAEHLNAWVILCRLVGYDPGVGDSLVLGKLGLTGATLVMLLVNLIFGAVILQLIRLISWVSGLL